MKNRNIEKLKNRKMKDGKERGNHIEQGYKQQIDANI
jgi:hypothetical protein